MTVVVRGAFSYDNGCEHSCLQPPPPASVSLLDTLVDREPL